MIQKRKRKIAEAGPRVGTRRWELETSGEVAVL